MNRIGTFFSPLGFLLRRIVPWGEEWIPTVRLEAARKMLER